MTDNEIADLIRAAVPEVVAVYRFGSTANGSAGPASDVDVAFLAARPFDPVGRFDLQERLAARLGRDVDLVDLQRASTVLRMQVLSRGRLLGSWDDTGRRAFEDRTYCAYVRLNEERRPILERIAREGRIHGR
jgi:predicted nucleotidyltransferase